MAHRLARWCSELETENEVVVYRADPEPTAWTRVCVRQADLLLLVADATTPPELARARAVRCTRAARSRHSRTELVLVHPAWTEDPRGTPGGSRPARSTATITSGADRPHDADRVARLLLSRGFGVVYSGGGARGIAELGVLRALREAHVPIDAAGRHQHRGDHRAARPRATWISTQTTRDAARGARRRQLPGRLHLPGDLHRRRRAGHRSGCRTAARGLDIEDAWLNGFCVSTNLTRGEVEIHRTGPAWLGLRAASRSPACSRRCAPPTATCSSTAASSTTCPSGSCAGSSTASP